MPITAATNLRCGACVESIRPALDGHARIRSWSVDLSKTGKPITVEGDLSREALDQILQSKGYRLIEPQDSTAAVKAFPARRYWPLLLILLYLLGTTIVLEIVDGSWSRHRAMARFMAGFFLVFSFFKLLNLRGFADNYRTYDILAAAVPVWGWVYPFVELALGVAYLLGGHSAPVNIITLVVMLVGTVGVARSLLKKRTISCACLGTVFDLPMSWVTLVEDLLMAGMAAMMLVV
jgi:hypothetical protein